MRYARLLPVILLAGCGFAAYTKEDIHQTAVDLGNAAVDRANLPKLAADSITQTAVAFNDIVDSHIKEFTTVPPMYYVGAIILFSLLVIFEIRRHFSDTKTHRLLSKRG